MPPQFFRCTEKVIFMTYPAKSLGNCAQLSYGVTLTAVREESAKPGSADADFSCCSWNWTFAQALALRFVA
jgi:hypothetical protein